MGADSVVVPVRAANRVQWVRGEQLLLPRLAARAGCEVVHSLASTAPATGRFARVTTIHDLNYKLVPDAHFGLRALGMRALVPLAARRSHRLLADSSNTRDDLVRHLRVPAGKVDVVPLGLGRPSGEPGDARRRAAAPLGSRATAGAAVAGREATAQEPHGPARRARADPVRAPAGHRAAGLRDAARAGTARAAARLGDRGGRALRGLAAGARRRRALRAGGRVCVPVVLRRLRPARARGDGARRPGRVRRSGLAARGGRRRRAALRSERPAHRSPRRSSACSAMANCRPSYVHRAVTVPRSSRGRAPPS